MSGGNKRMVYLSLGGQGSIVEAIKSTGYNVHQVDYVGAIRSRGYSWFERCVLSMAKTNKPKWIHMQTNLQSSIRPSTICKLREVCHPERPIITNWSGDIRNGVEKYFVDISKVCNASFISNVGQIKDYHDAGANNVLYLQAGYDPLQHYPVSGKELSASKSKYNHDVVFCGSNYGDAFRGSKDRRDVVFALKSALGGRFAVFGNGWGDLSSGVVGYNDQRFVYGASKIIISINNINDVHLYFSDRQLVSMASGRLVVSKYIGGMEHYFENKKHLVWFVDPDECVGIVKHYLDKKEEANAIGMAGYQCVLGAHTWKPRMKELVKICGLA